MSSSHLECGVWRLVGGADGIDRIERKDRTDWKERISR